jgi:GATA zinc finger
VHANAVSFAHFLPVSPSHSLRGGAEGPKGAMAATSAGVTHPLCDVCVVRCAGSCCRAPRRAWEAAARGPVWRGARRPPVCRAPRRLCAWPHTFSRASGSTARGRSFSGGLAPRGGRADAPFVSLESSRTRVDSTSALTRLVSTLPLYAPPATERAGYYLLPRRGKGTSQGLPDSAARAPMPPGPLWARSSPPPLTLRSSPLATRCFATPVTAPCTRWAASHTLGLRSSAPCQPPLCREPLPSLAPWARSPRHGCVSRVTPFAAGACYHRCPSHRAEHVGATGNSVSRGPTDTSLALLLSFQQGGAFFQHRGDSPLAGAVLQSPPGRERGRHIGASGRGLPSSGGAPSSLGGSLSSAHDWLAAAALGASPMGLEDAAARLLRPGVASVGAGGGNLPPFFQSGSLTRNGSGNGGAWAAAAAAAGSPATGRQWAVNRSGSGDPALQSMLLPHHWRNVSADSPAAPLAVPGDSTQTQTQLPSVWEGPSAKRGSPQGAAPAARADAANLPCDGDDDRDGDESDDDSERGVFQVDDEDEDGCGMDDGAGWGRTALPQDGPSMDDPDPAVAAAARATHEAGLALGKMVLQPKIRSVLLDDAGGFLVAAPATCRAPRSASLGLGLAVGRAGIAAQTSPGIAGDNEDGGSDNGGSSSGGSLARRTTSSGHGSPVSALPPQAAVAAAGAHALARIVLPTSGVAVASAAARAAEAAHEIAAGTLGRRCVHCGSNKTPQWRAGPVGAKTLCNACGVRYKNGRLQPICAFPPFGPDGDAGDAPLNSSAASRPSTMLSPSKRPPSYSTDVSDLDSWQTPSALLAPAVAGTVPKRPRGSSAAFQPPPGSVPLTT